MNYDIEHQGRWHRLQIDGSDLIAVEDHGNGTAFVTVYDGAHEDAGIAWSGLVSVTKEGEQS